MPRYKETGGIARAEDYLRGVALVDEAFTDNSDTVRAIINLSWHYPWLGFKDNKSHITEEDYEVWKRQLYNHIRSLIRKGVFVVTGAGNGNAKGYPAFFGVSGTELEIPEVLVVGGADPRTGEKAKTSFWDPSVNIPHIYAPGTDVIAAQGDKAKWTREGLGLRKKGGYKVSDGTSDGKSKLPKSIFVQIN